MQIPSSIIAYLVLFFGSALASPLVKERDAPFESVRTRLDRDFSKADADEPDKYFHEARFASHYDGRFADHEIPYGERQICLRQLIQTYLSSMADIGVETFIAHGTLLGWWWNRRIMPWDEDIDVIVSERSIHHLASYYNMTMHHFKFRGSRTGRDYLLEVNPHYVNDTTDKANVIDARWIDTDTGMFIDITTLRVNRTAQVLGVDGAMMIKDKHHYSYDDIYPLRSSVFEGFPVKVPFAYAQILVEEYGEGALTNINFQNHKFDIEKKEWIALGSVGFLSGLHGSLPNVGFSN